MYLFTGFAWLWITKASLPRTLSSKRTKISPLAKSYALVGVRGIPNSEATVSANSGNARPVKILSRFSDASRSSLIYYFPSRVVTDYLFSSAFAPDFSAAAADLLPARLRKTHPKTFRCFARPTPIAPAGTFSVITDPAAV